MDVFEQAAGAFFNETLAAFFNPQKRVFWGYLLSSLVIAVLWLLLRQRKSLTQSLGTIFGKKHWFSRSARADYALMLLNGVLMNLLIPRLLTKAAVAGALFIWLHDVFDTRPIITEMPDWLVALSFTCFLFFFDDFTRYWLHRWLHTIPILWAFHKVHHSATTLNPLTVYRTHPLEAVLFSLRSAFVQGVSIALFIFFFAEKVTLVTVFGATIFSFAFNLLGANLRHSPVAIYYPQWVERILISPAQHQLHHSTAPQHLDKNFGVILSIWDVLFKTHCHSQRHGELEYGLTKNQSERHHSLRALYIAPVRESCNHLKHAIQALGAKRFNRIGNKSPNDSLQI